MFNIREIRIKTTSYLLTPVRIAVIENTKANQYWKVYRAKRTLCTAGGNASCYSHYEKQHGDSLKH